MDAPPCLLGVGVGAQRVGAKAREQAHLLVVIHQLACSGPTQVHRGATALHAQPKCAPGLGGILRKDREPAEQTQMDMQQERIFEAIEKVLSMRVHLEQSSPIQRRRTFGESALG